MSKFSDELFHHHEQDVEGSNLSFHEAHLKCPIPGFEFSFFDATDPMVQEPISVCFCLENQGVVSPQLSDRFLYSFQLRAPPVLQD